MNKLITILILSVLFLFSVQAMQTPDLYLELNGENNWTDMTGNYTPTKSGTVTCSGDACNFDGSSGYIDAKIDFDGAAEYTISCWIKNDDWTSGLAYEMFVSGISGVTQDQSPGLRWDTGADDITVAVYTPSSVKSITVNAPSSTSIYYMVSSVYNGTHLRSWLNTTEATPTACTGAVDSGTNNIHVGAYPAGAFYYWDGDITSCFMSFDGTETTQTDIETIYALGANATYQEVLDAISPASDVTITANTYNVTSAYQNLTAWRTKTTDVVYSRDSTPSVTFDTSGNTDVAISLYDLNYTQMFLNNSDTVCATSNTTSHTCTLPSSEALSEGEQDIYISVQANQNSTSSSGALSISLDYAFTGSVTLDSNPAENAAIMLQNVRTNTTTDIILSNSTGGWKLYAQSCGNFSVFAYLENSTTVRPLGHGIFGIC